MSASWAVILFAIGFVALFVLGMSLTLIFKGHNIKSEIGDNEHMKARGIKCTLEPTDSDQLTVNSDRYDCRSEAGCNRCNIKEGCLR